MTKKRKEPTYLNPMTDFGFKTIFGNPDVMRGFLNALIQEDYPDKVISNVNIVGNDAPGESDEDRGVVFDIHCTTDDNEEFVVEMQRRKQVFFNNRIIYYLGRSFSRQDDSLDKEVWQFQTHKLLGVFLMDFYDKTMTKGVRHCVIKDFKEDIIDNDLLQYWKIQLPTYRNKKESDCVTPLDYWLYNIANMKDMNTALPFADKEPLFKQMQRVASYAQMSREDQDKYWHSYDQYVTTMSAFANERMEGREEGWEEGRMEGREEARSLAHKKELSSALNLYKTGLVTIDVIAQTMSIDLDELQEYIKANSEN